MKIRDDSKLRDGIAVGWMRAAEMVHDFTCIPRLAHEKHAMHTRSSSSLVWVWHGAWPSHDRGFHVLFVDGRRRTCPLHSNLRSAMRLHVVRHADPDYRVDGLTERGRAEAAALAQWMKRNDEFDVDRIYTSPMGRAVQTAKTIADAIDRNVLVEPWARELSEWRSLGGTGDAGGGGSGAVWDVDGESVRRAMRIGAAENDRECGTQVRARWEMRCRRGIPRKGVADGDS